MIKYSLMELAVNIPLSKLVMSLSEAIDAAYKKTYDTAYKTTQKAAQNS